MSRNIERMGIKNTICAVVIIFSVCIATTAVFMARSPKSAYETFIKLPGAESIVSVMYENNPEILYLLGNRHLGGDGEYDLEKAARYYDRALALDDTLPYLHYQRARIYFLTLQYRTAIEEVNKEIINNPNFSRSYYLRGLIYGYDKKLPEAASDFTEFINRQPDEWAGYNDLAWVLFQLGDYAGVKETIEQILPRARNAWLLNAYGVSLLNLGEFEQSKEAFLEAKDMASRMSPEEWGTAYIGNDPRIYAEGLEEMQQNIDQNIDSVNNRLSENKKPSILE